MDSPKKKKGVSDGWVTKPRRVMKLRWRQGLCSITGLPPSPLTFCLNLLLSRRGEQHRRCISALSAATTFTTHEDESAEGLRSHPDEQQEPMTQQETSNPQPLVSQNSKESNWIRINVEARLPSLQTHT